MTNRKTRYISNTYILFCMLCISISNIASLTAMEIKGTLGAAETAFTLDLRSRSGSPLLLELLLDDPAQSLTKLRVETEVGDAGFLLPGLEHSQTFLSPFYTPGIYPVTITVESEDDVWQRKLEIGFSEFIWGRDNFRFSNIRSEYWGILPYSKALFPWAEKRFGIQNPEDRILLLNVTYHIFNGRIGRCYAFSGSQVLYVRSPELLPRYYSKIYNIRETNISVQTEMNMLQNDIMYDHFMVNGYDYTIKQDLPALRAELTDIMNRISLGELVSIGYFNTQRHHSLLVYGYISDPLSNRVTLITGNNWGVEHEENLVSKAVVLIEVNLDESFTEPRVRWIDPPNSSYRNADHLFAVDVKDTYEHDPNVMAALISDQHALMKRAEKALIIVEQASEAVLMDEDGNKTGLLGRSATNEIDSVDYKQVDDTHIFEFPAELSLRLDFTPVENDYTDEFETDCSVYVLTYPVVDGVQLTHSETYTGIDFPKEGTFTLQVTPDDIILMNEMNENDAVSNEKER